MPSSTSNSSHRAPIAQWGRIWIVAILIGATVIGTYELVLRDHGYVPSVAEDPALWAHSFHEIPSNDERAVVILGSSRALAGLNLEEMAAGLAPRRPIVQLANSGGGTQVPIMQRLLDETHFTGTLIVDLGPITGVREALAASYFEATDKYDVSPAERTELELRLLLTSNVVFRLPELRPDRLVRTRLATGRWPAQVVRYDADRNRFMNFHDHPEDLEERLARRRGGDALPTDMPLANPPVDAELTRLAREVRERGATVVFLRMPYGPPLFDEDAARLTGPPPHDHVWDRLCRNAGALSVHFGDHAELRGFECPDLSHLDERDAVPFTRALVQILSRELSPVTDR